MNSGAFHDAVTKLLDGELSDQEFAELSKALSESPDARKAYLDAARLEICLDQQFALPLRGYARASSRYHSPARTQAKWSLGIAAAAVMTLGAILWSMKGGTQTHQPVTFRVCGNSEWSVKGAKASPGDELAPGQVFTIRKGAVELHLPNRVRAVVEAPAALALIDGKTLRLEHGRAYFRVSSRAGRGFTVVTPGQRVVDLGTAFGIEIRGAGGGAGLQVLEGKVRVDGLDGSRGETLIAGRSVLLDGKTVKGDVEMPRAGFLRNLPDAVATVFEDDFESGLLAGCSYAITMDPTVVRGLENGGGIGSGAAGDWNFSVARHPVDLVKPVSYTYGNVKPSTHIPGTEGSSPFLDQGGKNSPTGTARMCRAGSRDNTSGSRTPRHPWRSLSISEASGIWRN